MLNDSCMRDGLDAWQVNGTDFPEEGSPAEKLQFLVKYAVLAPSKYNAQPWLFEVCRDSLDLICDRNWAFRVTDPQSRELTLSCGAALLNLRLAAQHFGYNTTVEPFPWPGDRYLLARLRLGNQVARDWSPRFASSVADSPSDEELFNALKKRRTFLGSFWKGSPPDTVLARLCDTAQQHGAWVHLVRDLEDRRAVAELIAQGDQELMAARAFRRELARWIHPTRGRAKDGIPGASYGLSGPLNVLTPGLPWLIWMLNLGIVIGHHHRALAKHGPILAVLGTTQDTPRSWLAAGQAMQLVLLQATAAGLAASFLNQPIEAHQLRPQLGRLIGREGYPQILIRLGYATTTGHTPRRPAGEVLI
jgi:nitroreductase